MRKLTVILACLSILYAGAVWALDGCHDFGVGGDSAHHSVAERNHPGHEGEPASHHSHSDPTKLHCPNVLNEFLTTSRVTLGAPLKPAQHIIDLADLRHNSLAPLLINGIGERPPGSRRSQNFPRHLLFSVIRI
jgi:hypothetical protein